MIIGYGITTALSVLFFVLYRILIKKREFWLSLLFVCIAVVNVGYLMLSLAKTVEFAIFANDVAYLGSVFLSTCMLFTIIKLCGYKVTKAPVIIALSLGVVMFLIVATSGILPWFYKSVAIESINGATVLKKDYGILHPVYLVYLVLYFLAMITTIIHSIAKKHAAAQKFSVVMLGIVLINLFIWFIEKFGKWEFEFLSVSYIFSEILFVLLYWTMQDYIRKDKVQTTVIVEQKAPIIIVDTISREEKIKTILAALPEGTTLSARQMDVLECIIDGKSRKEIAADLHLSENTVKMHTSSLYRVLGVTSRDELRAFFKK